MHRTTTCTALFFILALLFTACADDPLPKPKGWLRLDLPEQHYENWEGDAPFVAEVPAYAVLVPRNATGGAKWFDMRFAKQRATVHMTWSAVNGDLPQLIEDAHTFKKQHEAKASRIGSERLLRDSARVFGTLFDVEGDVASPMVFYLTDSTNNFLYGALYFDVRPNADSLAPVTERLRADVRHFAATLRWLSDDLSGAKP